MESKELKIKQFERQMPNDQLRTIYAELLELKEQRQKLPSEITEKMYGVEEAAKWCKMSAAWIRKKIYLGEIKSEKNDKGKWVISWMTIQHLIEIKNKKHDK